ncbi:MAG: amidohydrolase [Acidimicrobiales bacterium]|nr:amidohydrolase [Acidimicrobiales bacterium]
MNVDDLILFSVDDHVIEPPDMFDDHVPAKYADAAPKVVRDDNGMENWVFQGIVAGSMGLNAVVSWPKDEWGFNPTTFAEMRPGCYDVHERIRDMNRNGILGSMNFPTFAGFSARTFLEASDKETSLVMLQAYNDWHIDEWCAAYPERLYPIGLVPLWDMDLMAAEVRRLADKGCRTISLPELPYIQNLPSFHSDVWDPVFTACCDTGVVVNLHIGIGYEALRLSPDAPIDHLPILATQVSALAATDFLFGPAYRKYPDLKVAYAEGGIGWIPFFLDRCDRHYENQQWSDQDFGGKLPSEVFREHTLACFVTDPTSLKLADDIGIGNIAWECDYPHSDCLWPDAPEKLHAETAAAGLSDEQINRITWQNAAEFFGIDPFANISQADATVGALRALSPDVETDIVSRSEWRRRYESVST